MLEQDKFTIRAAMRTDASAIHDLHSASVTALCTACYPLDLINRWIRSRTPEGYCEGIGPGEMFVCECGDMIVGFGHAVH